MVEEQKTGQNYLLGTAIFRGGLRGRDSGAALKNSSEPFPSPKRHGTSQPVCSHAERGDEVAWFLAMRLVFFGVNLTSRPRVDEPDAPG